MDPKEKDKQQKKRSDANPPLPKSMLKSFWFLGGPSSFRTKPNPRALGVQEQTACERGKKENQSFLPRMPYSFRHSRDMGLCLHIPPLVTAACRSCLSLLPFMYILTIRGVQLPWLFPCYSPVERLFSILLLPHIIIIRNIRNNNNLVYTQP